MAGGSEQDLSSVVVLVPFHRSFGAKQAIEIKGDDVLAADRCCRPCRTTPPAGAASRVTDCAAAKAKTAVSNVARAQTSKPCIPSLNSTSSAGAVVGSRRSPDTYPPKP